MSSVVMAIYYRQGRFGAAYYAERSHLLSVLPETSVDPNFYGLQQLFSEIKPTHILVNRVHDLDFLSFIRQQCAGESTHNSQEEEEAGSGGAEDEQRTPSPQEQPFVPDRFQDEEEDAIPLEEHNAVVDQTATIVAYSTATSSDISVEKVTELSLTTVGGMKEEDEEIDEIGASDPPTLHFLPSSSFGGVIMKADILKKYLLNKLFFRLRNKSTTSRTIVC
jgi:hypothetical protein